MVAPVPEPAQDQTSPPANSRIWLLTAFVTVLITAVFAAVLRFSSLPLGVTGEWVWPRIPADQVDLFSLVFSVFAVGIYLALWERSRRRIAETNRLDWQAALVILLAAILLPIWFRSIPFGIYGTSGMPWVTYFPRMSGYFSAAVESEGKLQQELAGYEGLVAQGDYLHEGTHPPGLLIYFSGLNSLCKSSPMLTDFLLWISGPELREGLDVLTEPPHQLTLPQRAALILNLWVTFLCTGLVVFPLFALCRSLSDSVHAWLLAGLWPGVAAVPLFAPKSDLLLALFSIIIATSWYFAVRKKASWLAAVAGIALWLGCMVSLALVVVPVFLGLWTFSELWRASCCGSDQDQESSTPDFSWQRIMLSAGAAMAGFVLPAVLFSSWTGANLWVIWQGNLSNHATFYDHNPRTYFPWLGVNLLELGWALSPAAWILLGVSLVFQARTVRRQAVSLWGVCLVLTWGLLWISGKNMGEAARLWIFLMPLLLSSIAPGLKAVSESASRSSLAQNPRPMLILLFCQLLSAIVAVCSIDAFDFAAFFT